jgi:hypothetical protein
MTIKIVRAPKPFQRDFHVVIHGEHRATFRSRRRYRQSGYDLEATDGGSIHSRELRFRIANAVKAEFREIVDLALRDKLIPTMAEIERVRTITQAEKEDREHDNAVERHCWQVRREVERAALQFYLEQPHDVEHTRMAETMLKELDR